MLPERLNEVFQNPLVLMPELAGKKMKDLPVDKKQELAAAINDFLEEHRQEIFAHLHERAFKDSQSQFLAQCKQLQSGIEGSQSIWRRAKHLLKSQFRPERNLIGNLNAIFVLDQISDPNTRQQVEKFLETIPVDQRTEQVLGDLIEHTKSYTDTKKLSKFFMALESFPASEIANIITFLPFIKNSFEDNSLEDNTITIAVLEKLAAIPETDRKDVLERANSFTLDPCFRFALLRNLCKLTKTERKIVFESLIPLLNVLSQDEIRDFFGKLLYEIHPEMRVRILNMIAEKTSTSFENAMNFLDAYIELGERMNDELIQQFTKRDYPDYSFIPPSILEELKQFPEGQRVNALSFAISLFPEYSKQYHTLEGQDLICGILRMIKDVRQEDIAVPWTEDIPPAERVDVLRAVLALPTDQRKAIVEQSAPFLRGMRSSNAIAQFLSDVSSVNPSEREEILKQVEPYLSQLPSPTYAGDLILAYAATPRAQRNRSTILKIIERLRQDYEVSGKKQL